METYEVVFHPDYVPEFRELNLAVKEALGEVFDLLRDEGPALGRPNVDTLKNSRHANMKEIRVDAADGSWRIALPSIPNGEPLLFAAGIRAELERIGSTSN